MKRRNKIWLAIPAVLLFFFLALDSLVEDSPTMDEQNHLARGLAYLRTGDPRLSLEHPPLINAISALPLLTLPDLRLPTDHPSWERPEGWYEFADLLLWQYNDDVTRMIFLARLPIVFLTLGLALTAYHFARSLWGAPAGLFAFYFLLFDPNILAHGRYTTTDLGGTAFLLLALFLWWRVWRQPQWHWPRLMAATVALGLAFGSKLSTLAFAPILVILAISPLYEADWRPRAAGRRLLQLAVGAAGALAVVWAIFGLQWGILSIQQGPLRFLDGVPGPVPTFWAGIAQIASLSSGGRPTFLLGATSTDGFLAYFPVAFLVKTPLATLLLVVASLWLLLPPRAQAHERRAALFLLLPAVLYFLLSMQSDLNIGYRHLLPMLPLLYLLIAGAMTSAARRASSGALLRPALYLLFCALLLSTLFTHPYYLSYFNLAAGGPGNGYKILVDSNVDWGQDLLRLRQWMEANGKETVKLAWFGSARPAYYGIRYQPLPGLPHHFDLWWDVPFDPAAPEPGTYAISASNLWELPLQEEKYVFPWFRARRPDDRVGYSILIYEVEPGDGQ